MLIYFIKGILGGVFIGSVGALIAIKLESLFLKIIIYILVLVLSFIWGFYGNKIGKNHETP
jgi:hypothetical protein